MHESRRLEGVSGRFPPEMAARHPPQLVIHQRNQAVERRGVSLAPGQEQLGYVVHAGAIRHQLVRGKRSLFALLILEEERRGATPKQSTQETMRHDSLIHPSMR